MGTPYLHIHPDDPDFLDLPWDQPLNTWDSPRLVDLPAGVHRHPVCFVAYPEGLYVIKELPNHLAHHEYDTLQHLNSVISPVAREVGLVERRWVDPGEEWSAAVITEYVQFAFPYRELITGGGFGAHRDQMLDAFAGLLAQLHLVGCFWGDCSLSNVLYRYDANQIEAVMIDAETVELHDELTDGQREADLDIMVLNVAGGMADIAAQQGLDLDEADLALGEEVTERYRALWQELDQQIVVGPHERYRIRERVERLNDLGFDVLDVELVPAGEEGDLVRMQVTVGGRRFHASRLRELTRIDASENQARQILSDLRYYEAKTGFHSATGKAVAAIKWRVDIFEPLLARIAEAKGPDDNPVQSYCDFLRHRFRMATAQARDVENHEALESWMAAGMPGPLTPWEQPG
jgi:hypothetical protein